MPQGSPILQFLRGMTRDELDAVRKRCDWCRVRRFDNKRDLSRRIRDSIERSVDSGGLTYTDAMSDIRRKVLISGPETTEQKIRNALRNTPVSAPVGDIRLVEEWLSAQLFGALNAKVRQPFEVYLEYPLNNQTRSQADLYVRHTEEGRDFLIEVKRGGEISNGESVKRQIEKYHQDIEQRHDLQLGKTFLCIIGEKHEIEEPENSETATLSDYFNVPSTLDDIETEITGLEVVHNDLGKRY